MTDDKIKLADKVDVEAIHFERRVRVTIDKAVVSFSPTQKQLYFNPKMVQLLNMVGWQQVLVGYDKRAKIMILKQCDVEEYGSVKVKTPSCPKAKELYKERMANCRIISIGHLMRSLELPTIRHYRAERDGIMIFLEAISKEE